MNGSTTDAGQPATRTILLPAESVNRGVEAVGKLKPHQALALHLNPPYPFTPPASPTALPTTSPRHSPQTATPVPRHTTPFPIPPAPDSAQ